MTPTSDPAHPSHAPHTPFAGRRGFLRRVLTRAGDLASMSAAAVAMPMLAQPARAATRSERRLALAHTHTGERVDLAFAVGERYLPESLATLDRFLRDHYSGEIGHIDPQLYDLLHGVQLTLGRAGAFEIISGYRCAATNERLRHSGGGGVARQSLHMEGRALDVRLPGVALADLRDAARTLRAGGVGFYARQQFVHVDTGRVRTW